MRWRTVVATGTAAAVGLTSAGCTLGGNSIDERPPARYDRIDDQAGAYGPVALGDTREATLAELGSRARAERNEPLSPTGAGDSFEGPTFIPMRSPDFYRYEDVVVWLDRGTVAGFSLTSPGAETSRGIGVGSDLDEVRVAYPELECGEAPAGDVATYPYCAGRLAPERWVWFGGDPVSNITFSSGGFG